MSRQKIRGSLSAVTTDRDTIAQSLRRGPLSAPLGGQRGPQHHCELVLGRQNGLARAPLAHWRVRDFLLLVRPPERLRGGNSLATTASRSSLQQPCVTQFDRRKWIFDTGSRDTPDIRGTRSAYAACWPRRALRSGSSRIQDRVRRL